MSSVNDQLKSTRSMSLRNVSRLAVFSIFKKKQRQVKSCKATTAEITAHMPGSTCGWVPAPGPTSSTPKQWKSDVHIKTKILSAIDSHWRVSRDKKYGEHSNLKRPLSGHWLAQCHSKWQRGCWKLEFQYPCGNWNHVAWWTLSCLNH